MNIRKEDRKMHEFIANLTTVEKIIIILLVILCLVLYSDIRTLIGSITSYFIEKATHESVMAKDAGYTVDNTIQILNLCKSMIEVEIQEQLKETIILHKKYEMRNLDNDAKTIAEHVFQALNQSFIQKKDFALNAEYILKYIANESLSALMVFTKDYNKNLNTIE